jgi:hypothetical protein
MDSRHTLRILAEDGSNEYMQARKVCLLRKCLSAACSTYYLNEQRPFRFREDR